VSPSSQTLTIQQPALKALAAIALAFPHLPAAGIHLSTIYPDQIDVDLHDDLSDFEAWREALDIAPDAVERVELPSRMTLCVVGSFAGAEVFLHGYAPLYATAALAPSDGQLAEQRHQVDEQDAAYRRVVMPV
jgi:hypothetical protein